MNFHRFVKILYQVFEFFNTLFPDILKIRLQQAELSQFLLLNFLLPQGIYCNNSHDFFLIGYSLTG